MTSAIDEKIELLQELRGMRNFALQQHKEAVYLDPSERWRLIAESYKCDIHKLANELCVLIEDSRTDKENA